MNVTEYYETHEWATTKLDPFFLQCPLDSNVGGDCKELIDSTDYIIQSMECHGGNKPFQSNLVKEVIHIMEIWLIG